MKPKCIDDKITLCLCDILTIYYLIIIYVIVFDFFRHNDKISIDIKNIYFL